MSTAYFTASKPAPSRRPVAQFGLGAMFLALTFFSLGFGIGLGTGYLKGYWAGRDAIGQEWLDAGKFSVQPDAFPPRP